MKASDYIVEYFHSKGIDVIFGYIGGMITHLVDSIDKHTVVRYIQTYHEQTAAIAAEGYALESGRPGVAIATSGPGATNLMTGIADAFFGSIPTIFITGQVNTYEYKYDKPVRQQGFQETDVVAMVKPITKYAKLVDDPDCLKYELEKAFYITMEGRKGPVLLDIPMNISRSEINPQVLKGFVVPDPEENQNIDYPEICRLIENSTRPLVLIGGGCISCRNEVDSFLKITGLPFVSSLIGKSIVPEVENKNCMGMIGSYGNRCANIAISQCDLLIALGARLDSRQTGAKIESFLPKGKIIQVDIDDKELRYNRLTNRKPVHENVSEFLKNINDIDFTSIGVSKWKKWLNDIKDKYNQDKEIERFVENKAPYRLMQCFNKISRPGDIIVADIGQNQMWVAQTLISKYGQHFYTSGGLAPMGFALPAAIGMAFANPKKTIYCFTGDGGFHMACQSLLLISQYNLNIKVLIFDNQSLGMITQFQHLYFNDRMAGTTMDGGYEVMNIEKMAESYHIPYVALNQNLVSEDKLVDLFSLRNVIIDYKIAGTTTVSPKLEYNQPIFNPTPLLSADELNLLIDSFE